MRIEMCEPSGTLINNSVGELIHFFESYNEMEGKKFHLLAAQVPEWLSRRLSGPLKSQDGRNEH